ncbi:MAG: DUF308 domain-containing protein, partial [Chloroflexia bacterium]|nr:DUF308 domain-containing protein [Chloroflexia bacterium]
MTLSKNWWATVVRGVAAIGLGLFAWARPDVFWPSLIVVFAIYAMVDGVFAIAAVVKGNSGDRWLHLLEGIFGIGAAISIVLFPERAGEAIVLVIGLWAIVTGVFEVFSAVRLRREITDEWLLGTGGVLSIALGALLIARPQFGQVTTTYVLGTYGI